MPSNPSKPAAGMGGTSVASAAAAKASSSKKTTKKSASAASAAGGAAKPKKKAVRRKKPSGSAASRAGGSAGSAEAILGAARTAQLELQQHSAAVAARRSDPLWFRVEDPIQSIADGSTMAKGGAELLQDQVQLVENALGKNYMTRADVTPQAFACLLEQGRRYALELLADAQDYAYSANRHDISKADLLLANELRADQPLAVATQTPKLMAHGQLVNRIPLPPIPTHCYNGVVLPPEQYLLTSRTFDVVTGAQVSQRMVAPVPQPPPSSEGDSSTKPTYGASRGRQIPIQLKQDPNKAKPASQAQASTGPQPMAVDAPAPSSGITLPGAAGVAPPASSGDTGAKRKADEM